MHLLLTRVTEDTMDDNNNSCNDWAARPDNDQQPNNDNHVHNNNYGNPQMNHQNFQKFTEKPMHLVWRRR